MMHVMKWGRRRYRRLAIFAGLALLAAATVFLSMDGDRGPAIATVLGFTVAVLALSADVWGVPWKKTPDTHSGLAAAARALARQVGQREAAEQQKFLADVGQSQPANVRFSQPDLVYWRIDGGQRQGALSDIATYYTSLHYGRLLVLGEAGAGKTVLANQLLLDLTTNLPAVDPPPGATLSVPIRLSLPTFDPGGDHADADALASSLNAWISGHLTTVYGVTPNIADTLVRDGWILPILDGLDEMDPTVGPPARAAAVIRALNYPAGPSPRPVVLSCRTARYQDLTQMTMPGQETILQDVTAIRVQPLTPSQISGYLIRRFPDPVNSATIQQRWQPVLDHLTRHPVNPLAATLSSPLWLFMAVTAYHRPGTDPARLTTMSGDALRHDLLTSLIPAITNQRRRPEGGSYQPVDVTCWLTTLAKYLHTCQAGNQGSGSDIDLHELWPAAGNRAPRYLSAIIQAAAVFALAVVTVLLGGFHAPDFHALSDWIIMILVGALVLYTSWRASRRPVKLSRLDIFQLFVAGRRRFAAWFAFGFVIGSAVGFGWGFTTEMTDVPGLAWRSGLATAVAFGLAGGLAGGFASGLAGRPKRISRPRELVTQGLTHDITICFTFGLGGGLAIGLETETTPTFMPGYSIVFSSGLPLALVFGFAGGLTLGTAWMADSPWPRYFIATRILAYHRQLPRRPARFFDWAYTVGLLRLSGISIQFRHHELQDYLVRPTTGPAHAAK
jgi:NACHT domain